MINQVTLNGDTEKIKDFDATEINTKLRNSIQRVEGRATDSNPTRDPFVWLELPEYSLPNMLSALDNLATSGSDFGNYYCWLGEERVMIVHNKIPSVSAAYIQMIIGTGFAIDGDNLTHSVSNHTAGIFYRTYITGSFSAWKVGNQDYITAQISALLDGTDPDKVDSLKDLIAWVEEHSGEASKMASAIEKNTTDIANEVTRAKTEESRISAEVQYLTTRVIDYSKMYLTFVALEDGLTAKLSRSDCEYCIDGDGWIFLPAGTFTAPIYTGQKLSFRCVPQTTIGGVGIFTVTKKYNVEGNIMSLLSGDDFVANPNFKDNEHQVFNELFTRSETLIDASALVLPSKITTQRCYQAMFAHCTSLVNAPQLLATNVGYYSYNNMFSGCTSLAVAPVLQGITLGDHSYNTMFTNCTNLKYVKAMFTTIPGENHTNNWLANVAPSGTFVKSKDATWDVVGGSGIPEGWTVVEV